MREKSVKDEELLTGRDSRNVMIMPEEYEEPKDQVKTSQIRGSKVAYLIYPNNKIKFVWDMLITM